MNVDIVVGILGAIVGGWIISLLGYGSTGGFIGSVIAILGAVLLIWIARLLKAQA